MARKKINTVNIWQYGMVLSQGDMAFSPFKELQVCDMTQSWEMIE